MEVTALCIRLLINMWLLLVAHVQDSYYAQADAAFPDIVPNRMQHFEYESISFNCEGFDESRGWRARRKIHMETTTCGTNWGISKGSLCTIRDVYIEDSGEYWCETGDGKKSNTVNITITAGSVILESPVLPVMEGEALTLRCRNKTASSNISASFYKNGFLIKNVSTGNMTIRRVSKSDEGLYKCHIFGAGESAESRLTVTEYHKETLPCFDQLPVLLYLLIRIVATLLWAALLLLVLRKRRSGKHRGEKQTIN